MQTERMIWHNGLIEPESEAVISVYSSGAMFADLPFEMQRTFNRKTFKLQEHLDRLYNSCKVLEIDMPYDKSDLYDAHEALLQWHIENFPDEEEWRMLINVNRGILPIYQEMLGDEGRTDIMITCFPLRHIVKGMSWVYDGVKAIVPSQRALPHHLLDSRMKTRSRQHLKMANLEIEKIDKHAFPLLLDPDGFVAESTGSNFFIVKNGRVFTPHGRNCLRGISRQFILDGMPQPRLDFLHYPIRTIENIGASEKDITLFDVISADEAFFTNTPYAIIPCTSINGLPIGNGVVGDKTKWITEQWANYVDCDFVSQMRRWDKA